mgnify:FL=1
MFQDIFMVGGGSKSSFWLSLLSSILQRNLLVCDESEFGASLGVARLAMYMDKDIADKNSIIKKIKSKKIFNPLNKYIDVLEQRYHLWKNIYSTNKKLTSLF